MVVSAWGKRWKRVHLVMCRMTGYIDDSGTAPDQSVAIATALVIPASRIVSLEREWDSLKEKEGFSCFHMAEFADAVNWKEENHSRIYRRVREITKKYGVRTVSFAVLKSDYDEVVPPELRRHSGTYHYSWAVRHLIDSLLGWRRLRVPYPLEYVFDFMKPNDPRRKEIEAVMDQQEDAAEAAGYPGEFKNFGFRERCEIPGLQCVDVLAWISYQTALFEFTKKKLHPDAKVGWRDFDSHLEGKWRIAGTLRRSELERWVGNDAAVEHTKKWFAAWEKRKIAEKQNAKWGKTKRKNSTQ
jgi:uncharacterized protein DUF3800